MMKYPTRNMDFFTKLSSLLPLYSFRYSNTTELGFPISKVNGWTIYLHVMMDLKTGCENTGLSLLIRRKQSDIITVGQKVLKIILKKLFYMKEEKKSKTT